MSALREAWADRLARIAVRLATSPVRRRERDPVGAIAERFVTRDGIAIHALRMEPHDRTLRARATVVLAHGYRDGRGQLRALAHHLEGRGFRTLTIDFRGHGASAGDRIAAGGLEGHDVRAALDHARAFGDRVLYVGFSMGAGAYLLADQEADAAVLDSPFETLFAALEARTRRLGLDARGRDAVIRAGERLLALRIDDVQPIAHVSRLRAPTLVVFAKGDEWIDATGRARFADALSPSCFLSIVDGHHRDHLTRRWIDEVSIFLERFAPR